MGGARSKWQVKNSASAFPAIYHRSQNDQSRPDKSMRSARNLAIHVAATEGNRRRPLRPLRTGIQETIITHRENRARTVKSSPRGVSPDQLCRNGPTKQGHVLLKLLQARHRLSEKAVANCVIADVIHITQLAYKSLDDISGGLLRKCRMVLQQMS